MFSFSPSNIYTYINNNDIQSLEKNKNDLQYLIRDENQITPLSSCIIKCNNDIVNQLKNKEILMFLLQNGGCSSIFVKGYMEKSILCTLPMAHQPQSSVFNWPSPIKLNDDNILNEIDSKFVLYIKTLSENSKNNKKIPDNDDVISTPPKPAFDHYPQQLNIGDRVRRGPSWMHGSQDERNKVQYEGIVTDISGSSVDIDWVKDPTNPNNSFNSNTYIYDPPSICDVYLVDASDPNARPSNMTPSIIAPTQRFMVGDRVQLVDYIQQSSLVPPLSSGFTTSFSKFSDNCLGKGRVGIIVSRSEEKRLVPGKSSQMKFEFTVNVMAAHSGQIMEYLVTDLRYADGSAPGLFRDLPAPIFPTLSSTKFSVGDRVKIRPDAKNRNGCLYKHYAGFIGRIYSISGTSISVTCDDARCPGNQDIASIISWPSSTYPCSDLMSADAEPLPLAFGDIVELSNTFPESSGWCLGDLKDKRKGIVRFAPYSSGKDEQRDIFVQSLDNPKEIFSFRSKWLIRSLNNGTTVFKVGDRVKLDIGNWKKKGTSGKCLGAATCGFYGIVVNVGSCRDGIQRNIGVVACSGERKRIFSYYSGFHLVAAPRLAVLTDADWTSLITEVDQLLKLYNLYSIDAEIVVNSHGISVWSFICSLVVIPKSKVVEAFERWDSNRLLNWPSDDDQAKSVVTDLIPSIDDVPFHWKCLNKKCLCIGGYDKNSIKDKMCIICKVSAPMWDCSFCSSTNKPWDFSCISCFSKKVDSIALHGKFKTEQAANVRLEKKVKEREVVDEEKATKNKTKKVDEILRLFFYLIWWCGIIWWLKNMFMPWSSILYKTLCFAWGFLFLIPLSYFTSWCDLAFAWWFIVTGTCSKDLFVRCGKSHEVYRIVHAFFFDIGSQDYRRVQESNTCSLKGPRCKSTPVHYCCRYCCIFMCIECYSDEEKRLQALLFKTEVSKPLEALANIYMKEQQLAQSSIDSNDDDNHDKDDDSAIDSKDSDIKDSADGIPDDYEVQKNAKITEKVFLTGDMDIKSAVKSTGDTTLSRNQSYEVERQTSDSFYKLSYYDEINDISELISFCDKNGNTALHYVCSMGFRKSAEFLISLGSSEWKTNNTFDTPRGLLDGLPLGVTPVEKNILHLALAKRELVPTSVIKSALSTPFDYSNMIDDTNHLIALIKEGNEDEASYLADDCVTKELPHALLYRALFRLEFSYGPILTKTDLQDYLDEVSRTKGMSIDPLYYYVCYRLWKYNPSHLRADKLRAYDAITALKLFPATSRQWLDDNDTDAENFEKKLTEEGIDLSEPLKALEDDDLLPDPGPLDPEMIWEKIKRDHKLNSPSMDKLMKMVGLKRVKEKAISIALNVLLNPPEHLKSETSMNLLFTGNPGTGKTTAATLIAQALAELGYRKNPVPVLTSAETILGASDPFDEFMNCVKQADGGTLFIDESYLFEPAPKGQAANASNKVLNALLKESETKWKTTTFILSGYKEEMDKLLTYNDGFPSRFPKRFRFEFEDYTELQLTKILVDMTKQRGYRFQSKAECGVFIAKILGSRISKGAKKKGFGNGREVRSCLDECRANQDSRLGRLKLAGISLKSDDYSVITRSDAIGDRPRLEDNPYMLELYRMVGLKQVKENMTNLMNLQLQNYDSLMRGDQAQEISLHRVFLGNPGTGKTTVAKLYGKLLKAFGYLSDGDFIMTTPSDLKGSAVGEAAERTRVLIDSAKGKVLFIDEAYNLDPKRHAGGYGAEVIDTLIEKIEANAGSDMAVILAGYKPQMEELFRNCNNPGLKRRLNMSEAFLFEDFSDDDIKKVLKSQIVNNGLACTPSTLDFAVGQISKKRMEPGFGNAGEAEQILTRAKLRLSSRLSKGDAKLSNMKLLINHDFAGEETSVEKAREAFADLENIEHIEEVINKFEAMVVAAKDEDRKPHECCSNMHMLLLGPPGTGKTTCARKLAIMMKQLEVLPTDRFEYVTASNLIDRYVGGTFNNTVEAMRRALGGILFIDEAYGMRPGSGNLYGREIMQALLDNITTDEFKGKVIIVMGGYKEQMEELFNYNPGFQSRFDKMRINFEAWTGQQASNALINSITRDGKTISFEAKHSLPAYFSALAALPNWASARDVMEIVKPLLEQERASRSFTLAEKKRQLETGIENKVVMSRSSKLPSPVPYELTDVTTVFTSLLRNRGGSIDNLSNNSTKIIQQQYSKGEQVGDDEFAVRNILGDQLRVISKERKYQSTQHTELTTDSVFAPAPPKYKHNFKFKENNSNNGSNDGDDEVINVWEALEAACAKLGWSLDQIKDMLEDASNFPPKEILDIVMNITECKDASKVKGLLVPQRMKVLEKIKTSIKMSNKIKSAKEARIQEALNCIGKCCMGFEWLKIQDGYQCAGGSHFCSDDDIANYMSKL